MTFVSGAEVGRGLDRAEICKRQVRDEDRQIKVNCYWLTKIQAPPNRSITYSTIMVKLAGRTRSVLGRDW